MTEQTDAAVVLSRHERADLFNAACRAHSGPPTFICRPCADAQDAVIERIIRDREAAAEVRGAQAVLAAVEGLTATWPTEDNGQDYRRAVRQCANSVRAAARAAAAVTISSAKSSDLATRVPQDESQRAAGGGGEA